MPQNIYTERKTGLDDYFNRVDHNTHTTRYANNVNIKVSNYQTEKGRRAFTYRGAMTWNLLDNELKSCKKFDVFKKKLLARTTKALDNHPT